MLTTTRARPIPVTAKTFILTRYWSWPHRTPASSGEFVRDEPERSALLPHGEHHRAVVLEPPDEEVPADDPEERRHPPVGDPDERPQNRPERRDALELVAPQDVPTHREVLDPVHVHVCGRGPLRVGLPHVPVDPLAVAPIGYPIQANRNDYPQERSSHKVGHSTASRIPHAV